MHVDVFSGWYEFAEGNGDVPIALGKLVSSSLGDIVTVISESILTR